MYHRLAFGVSLAASLALLLWLLLAVGATGAQPATPVAWTRNHEAAILSGEQLSRFANVALDELFVYAYTGSDWQPIPFQFDEVDATGVYTVEDGQLDANDELVFMALDLGTQAAPTEWLADAQDHLRYEVRVADPLHPAEQGWVYVYRSEALTPGGGDYVAWDPVNDRVLAETYVAGFAPAVHPGLDALELNDSGVDALDRSKIRLEVTCWIGPIPVEQTLTEEDLGDQFDARPNIDGPVRVGRGDADGVSWFYHSLFQSRITLRVDDFEPPDPCSSVEINAVRISVDWLDPASSGMAPAVYYDGNTPGGVPIDGSADGTPTTPVAPWKQVSGGQGSAVQVVDVALDGGALTNYYKDDQTVDPDDTGDGQSFGDAGFRVDAPSGEVVVDLLTFVLDPGQPNVGATYLNYFENPLQIAVTVQGDFFLTFLPLLFKDR